MPLKGWHPPNGRPFAYEELAVTNAAAVIGNSSSGVIEAPALGVPTVNIGTRQQGRLKAASVIDAGESADEIAAAIVRALDPAFRATIAGQTFPYGGGGAAGRIVAILKSVDPEFRDMVATTGKVVYGKKG